MDPGLNITGWGLVRVGPPPICIDFGSIRTRPAETRAQRLLAIHGALRDIIRSHPPAAMAVEEPFVAANIHSAFAIGEARAAAMLAAAGEGVVVFSYSPATVKETVAGYGRGDKRQVQEMVRLQLGLATGPEPQDAADALAVALCHAAHLRVGSL